MVIGDLAHLDRQIQQEKDEIARHMPFTDIVDDKRGTADSPPRMDSPKPLHLQ